MAEDKIALAKNDKKENKDEDEEEETILMNETKKEIDVDQMLPYIGEFKKFQWILEALFCLMTFPQTYQILIMYFAALQPNWKCVENSTICLLNSTYGTDRTERCSMPRSEWEFTQPKDYSIVTQFDIYCDQEWKIHLTTSILFIGWGIGAIVLGWVADNYGRKIVLFPSMAVVMIGGFITAFLPNISSFIVLRFIVGFFTPGTGVQVFIIISEFVSSRYRPKAGITLWFFFSAALCILGLKAYFIRQWKILFIVCTVPYIFVLAFYKFIPESVRWLRLKGKKKEAMSIFHRIAKWNKKVIPKDVEISVPSIKHVEHKSSPLDLFRTKKIAISTCVQGFAWMVNGMVYYGLSLAADDLGGGLYMNYVLLSAVEFPAIIMAIDFCERFGRKKTVITAMFIGSIACIIVAFIPEKGDIRWGRVILGMLGKYCITLSFDSIYTWSLEIFPTTIRAEGMGFLQVTSRIGAASAPWVAKGLKQLHKSVPFIFMGILAIIATGLCLILPETRGVATAEVDVDSLSEFDEGKEMLETNGKKHNGIV